MHDTYRRDALLDAAVAAGKFSPDRCEHWRRQYDTDAVRTEAALALMTPVFQPDSPYPRELFPELGEQRAASPLHTATLAAAQAPVGGEDDVARWSRHLFPETQSAPRGRVTKAHD